MPPQKKRPYEPSRGVVNAGVVVGGILGIMITVSQSLTDTNAFLITGFCCLATVALFSYFEIFIVRPRQKQ